MRAKTFFTVFLVLFAAIIPGIAQANIVVEPDILYCPDARVGESVACSALLVQNVDKQYPVTIVSVENKAADTFAVDATSCVGATIGPESSCTMPVTFKPNAERNFFVIIRILYKTPIRNRTVEVDVHGRGVRPAVSLSTDTADFGDQTVNTSSWQYVRMENVGSQELNIGGMTIPLGSGFSVASDCGNELVASASCTIQVFFDPTAEISYASTVKIYDDAEDSPQTIAVSGTGIAAGRPDVALDKTTIDFEGRAIGSTTTDTITVTNVGTAALTFTNIVAYGNSFSQTNDCGAVLGANASCTISVTFSPADVGVFGGLVILDDDATDSPQTVTLRGRGVAPDVILRPSLIEFGDQTVGKSSAKHEITLLNSGTSDLTISNISTSDAVFSQTNDCPGTLGAQQLCTILATFAPTSTTQYFGSVIVESNAISGDRHYVHFNGTGITGPDVDIVPALYDFGEVAVGQESWPQEFSVINTGEGDLSIYSIAINSDFDQTNDCPETLSEEESCAVSAVFAPEVSGNFVGLLSIFDNATGSPHTSNLWGYGTTSDVALLPASVNFGDQTVGRSSLPHDILFQNTGNTTIEITKIETGSAVFTQTNDCAGALAPSAYCTISATFTPVAIGVTSGAVTITDSATGSPHNVDLFGAGLDPIHPDVDVSPNFWDFGNVLVGQTSAGKAFTLKNTGVVDVTITSIDTDGVFAQINDCPTKLSSGEECTITATFSPQSSGNFTGHIRIVNNTPRGYQLAALKGMATHSGDIDISLSTSKLDFGRVNVDATSDSQTLVVTNSGNADITIGAVILEGSQRRYFSTSTNCQDRILDIGKSCAIDVRFSPALSGRQSAAVLLYDDAPNSPQSVDITGVGVEGGGGCVLAAAGAPVLPAALLLALAPCLLWACRRLRKSPPRNFWG